jgi:hypothetical protein
VAVLSGAGRGSEPGDWRRLRRIVVALVALGLLGITAELLLIEHVETVSQLVPVVVMPVAAALLVPVALGVEPRSAMALRLALAAVVAAGLFGVALHLYESWEFQAEIDPSIGPAQQAWAALRAQSPPSLAPGQIALLGLLGLAAAAPASKPATREGAMS